MASINDSVNYGNIFLNTTNQNACDDLKKVSADRRKSGHKKIKKSLTHRHPLNVRIDDDLRREFVVACKKTKTPQHIPLEKALRRILKSMEKR